MQLAIFILVIILLYHTLATRKLMLGIQQHNDQLQESNQQIWADIYQKLDSDLPIVEDLPTLPELGEEIDKAMAQPARKKIPVKIQG